MTRVHIIPGIVNITDSILSVPEEMYNKLSHTLSMNIFYDSGLIHLEIMIAHDGRTLS